MKPYIHFCAALALLAAQPALAHEHQVFEIGGALYDFTVGSLNEPVTVDDKTGVDLRVKKLGGAAAAERHEEDAAHEHAATRADVPVTGLESTLKVELIAGDKKRVLDLAPAFNDPGAYRAPFYPTVQTTLTYRVFGTIANVPVDLSFTCNPAGHPASPEDTTEVQISDHVHRVKKSGAFGCPVAKAALGFPEESATVHDTNAKLAALEAAHADLGATSRNFTIFALVVGLLGAALGGVALMRGKMPGA